MNITTVESLNEKVNYKFSKKSAKLFTFKYCIKEKLNCVHFIYGLKFNLSVKLYRINIASEYFFLRTFSPMFN